MKFMIEGEKMIEVLRTAIGFEESADYWWRAYSDSNETDNDALAYFREEISKAHATLYAFEILTGVYIPNNLRSIKNVIDAIKTDGEVPQYI